MSLLPISDGGIIPHVPRQLLPKDTTKFQAVAAPLHNDFCLAMQLPDVL
jgi:hypothetical protein